MSSDPSSMLRTSDFNYELPPELIAQHPLADRSASRLLCLNRASGDATHRQFCDLPGLLKPGDLLVVNDTRVIPARMYCTRSTGTKVELLFTKRIDPVVWVAIVHPGRSLKKGVVVTLDANSAIALEVRDVLPDGSRVIGICRAPDNLDAIIERYGSIPLPHYLNHEPTDDDRLRYQTVYARVPGAVAAPTAGLHFTPETLSAIRMHGVQVVSITLHVGVGTFRPVKTDIPADHIMHAESYELAQPTVDAIIAAKEAGGRVVAVGTTVVRTLEHVAALHGRLCASSGETSMFILPGYRFNVVDALITNFHLPRSTLLMLVSAFAGRENVLAAYAEAVQERYRFFSYGDAMFIC